MQRTIIGYAVYVAPGGEGAKARTGTRFIRIDMFEASELELARQTYHEIRASLFAGEGNVVILERELVEWVVERNGSRQWVFGHEPILSHRGDK